MQGPDTQNSVNLHYGSFFSFFFSDGTLWFIWLLGKGPRISQTVFIVLSSGFWETEEKGKKNTDNREKQVWNTCDIELNITEDKYQVAYIVRDDAVKFTSEMHDPCAQESPTHEKKTRTPYRRHRCGADQTPSEG